MALSMHADRESHRPDAGGGGLGSCSGLRLEELLEAIHTVLAGRPTSAPAADAVAGGPQRDHRASRRCGDLTQREREVLKLIAEGRTSQDTATELLVSVKTVETHRQNMMDKLAIRAVAELTAGGIREGITTCVRGARLSSQGSPLRLRRSARVHGVRSVVPGKVSG